MSPSYRTPTQYFISSRPLNSEQFQTWCTISTALSVLGTYIVGLWMKDLSPYKRLAQLGLVIFCFIDSNAASTRRTTRRNTMSSRDKKPARVLELSWACQHTKVVLQWLMGLMGLSLLDKTWAALPDRRFGCWPWHWIWNMHMQMQPAPRWCRDATFGRLDTYWGSLQCRLLQHGSGVEQYIAWIHRAPIYHE